MQGKKKKKKMMKNFKGLDGVDGLNPNATFVPWNPARIVTIPNPLVVTYLSTGANTAPASLNAFNPNLLHLFDSTGNVVYEKVLETILNQEMTNRNI